jgi:hypothetical protein
VVAKAAVSRSFFDDQVAFLQRELLQRETADA